MARPHGFDPAAVSVLTLTAVHPFPAVEARALLAHCQVVLVLEELEPIVERGFYVEAQKMGWNGPDPRQGDRRPSSGWANTACGTSSRG